MIKKLLPLLVLIISLSSCSSSKTITSNKTQTKKVTTSENKAHSSLHKTFRKYEGTPYKYGGNTTKGIDCSGFVCAVYREVYNKRIPRTTGELKKYGKKVNTNQLKPGDLVFYRPNNKYNHVGVYLGNGYVGHSTSSRGVIKTKLNNSYWKKYYVFSRRIL